MKNQITINSNSTNITNYLITFNPQNQSLILDYFYFYLSSPLSIIGSILNLINFIALHRWIKFQKTPITIFHQYLKIYSMFSLLICLIILFNSMSLISTFLCIKNYYWLRFYRCKMLTWFTAMLIQFLNLLDCILLVERLSKIDQSSKIIKYLLKFNSYLLSFILFLICNLINLPSYFLLLPRNQEEEENFIIDEKTSYCDRNTYFIETNGRIFVYIVIILRDVLTISTKIILAIITIRSLRNYLQKTIDTNTNHLGMRIVKKSVHYNSQLTKMTLYLSLLSILSHIVFLSCYLLGLINVNDSRIFLSLFLASFIILNLKYSANFYLFYQFNEKFREYFNSESVIYNEMLFFNWKVKISCILCFFQNR
jgi:hypothetical protein